MCQVVVGVGHVYEPLDQAGPLDEAEEHLRGQGELFREAPWGWSDRAFKEAADAAVPL